MLVQEKLKADPFGGQLFVFRGKRGDLIKLIWLRNENVKRLFGTD
jgi:transposase